MAKKTFNWKWAFLIIALILIFYNLQTIIPGQSFAIADDATLSIGAKYIASSTSQDQVASNSLFPIMGLVLLAIIIFSEEKPQRR